MRRVLLIASMLACMAPVQGHAAGGCTTTNSGALGNVVFHNCRYTATGAGTFTAMSVNHWRIAISKDGGKSFKTVVDSARIAAGPRDFGSPSLYAPASGSIPSVAGDLVDVAIYPDPLILPPADVREEEGQDFAGMKISLPFGGYIDAHDG